MRKLCGLAALLAASAGAPLWGQCSMCRSAAAAAGPGGINAMNAAIVVLFVPAVALFCGVFVMAARGGRDGTGSGEDRE